MQMLFLSIFPRLRSQKYDEEGTKTQAASLMHRKDHSVSQAGSEGRSHGEGCDL